MVADAQNAGLIIGRMFGLGYCFGVGVENVEADVIPLPTHIGVAGQAMGDGSP